MATDDRCSIANCRRPPVLTYLEARLCQRCWERACDEANNAEAAAAESAVTTSDRPDPDGAKEIDMSKKSTKKTTPAKAPKEPKAAKTKATKAKAEKAAKPPRPSALNAAATVLAKAGKPMRSSEMIAAMAEQKLWTSPGGKTPEATLYAAIIREIRDRKGEARFKKVDRGQFTINTK